ncbi:MAG: c-type cytochrome [Burkholderiaceae bacterium]
MRPRPAAPAAVSIRRRPGAVAAAAAASLVVLAAAGLMPPAHAAPDAATREAAQKLATQLCVTCHGAQGRGENPRIPRLAGQQKAYIEVQLKAFRAHTRGEPAAHETMWGVAALLSDDVVTALAEYYASQTPASGPAAGAVADAAAIAKGRVLFDKGSPERGLPACAGCHGANAEGLAVFPRLAGQHAQYLFIQLQAIRHKLRASPVMHGLIKELADDEIVALAAYLESK